MAFDSVALSICVNQVQMVYNDFGQLITEYQSHNGAVNVLTTPKVQYTYADGSNNSIRQTGLVYPNGRTLTYSYGTTNSLDDALSRTVSIIDDDSTHLVDYEYLGSSTFVTSTSPEPGIQWTLVGSSNDPDTGDIYTGLDRFGRVKNNSWHKAGTDLDRIKYGYDRASNRIWRKNPVAQSYSAEFDEIYTYDGSHRLKEMARGTLNIGHTALTSKTFGETWNLDEAGNWSAYTRDDDGNLTNDLVQARTANQVNEIGTITNSVGASWAQPAYSPAGNMTTIPQPKDPSKEYLATYDAWNRLVKLEEEVSSTLETVAEYQYDGRKFQIIQREYTDGVLDVTKRQYFTDGWQNIEQRDDGISTPAQQYVWGLRYIDDCVFRDRSTDSELDERLYCLQDANWNAEGITDNNGNTLERYAYSAYGAPSILSPTFDMAVLPYRWEILYCGYQYNKDKGLYNVRARRYSPTLGVWALRDPIVQSLDVASLYEYTLSSPLDLLDPQGMDSVSAMYPSNTPPGPWNPNWTEEQWREWEKNGGVIPGHGLDEWPKDFDRNPKDVEPTTARLPIYWGEEFQGRSQYPTAEAFDNMSGECTCQMPFSKMSITRPRGMGWSYPTPGQWDVPCTIGTVVTMRYPGACVTNKGQKDCSECDSKQCSFFILWICKPERLRPTTKPGTWAVQESLRGTKCS